MTGPAGGRGRPDPGVQPVPSARSRLTSRAAVLAVVLCAIALSLAYPVREYIAQRRQIDQLEAQRQAIGLKVSQLQQEQQRLSSNAYVEQQAENRLHMCLPGHKCYVVINPPQPTVKASASPVPGTPWYERVWSSVQQADKPPSGKTVTSKPVSRKPASGHAASGKAGAK
ncbi:MAG TPA: septum formation initiator family protein [Streptosporangiaceae bacterium]|nr:septum formation initiator family protein [Streptosporangiaceae bacterium]